jgi:1-acyl-sn-glycerol-3-phosphate acyltransferase
VFFWVLVAMAWAAVAVCRQKRRSCLGWTDFTILFLARVYCHGLHRWRSTGFRHLPATGPALVICNHTCSADPTFLLGGSRRPLSFMVAREHFDIHPFTTWILTHMHCVKASRNGRDATSLRGALRCLAAGRPFTIFPEGNLSGVARKRLLPAKLGAAWLALVSRAPVYPVFIAGGPRTEKLVYSWLVPAAPPVRVMFGKAIDLSPYYGRLRNRQTLEEVSGHLMRHIAALNPDRRSQLASRAP